MSSAISRSLHRSVTASSSSRRAGPPGHPRSAGSPGTPSGASTPSPACTGPCLCTSGTPAKASAAPTRHRRVRREPAGQLGPSASEAAVHALDPLLRLPLRQADVLRVVPHGLHLRGVLLVLEVSVDRPHL